MVDGNRSTATIMILTVNETKEVFTEKLLIWNFSKMAITMPKKSPKRLYTFPMCHVCISFIYKNIFAFGSICMYFGVIFIFLILLLLCPAVTNLLIELALHVQLKTRPFLKSSLLTDYKNVISLDLKTKHLQTWFEILHWNPIYGYFWICPWYFSRCR